MPVHQIFLERLIIVRPRAVEAFEINRIFTTTETDTNEIVGDGSGRYIPLEIRRVVPVGRMDDVVAEFLRSLQELLQISDDVTLLERVRDQFVIRPSLLFEKFVLHVGQ